MMVCKSFLYLRLEVTILKLSKKSRRISQPAKRKGVRDELERIIVV